MGRDFGRTPTGRFRKDTVGECGYNIPMPVMPASIKHWDNAPLNMRKKPVRPLDGEHCPLRAPITITTKEKIHEHDTALLSRA